MKKLKWLLIYGTCGFLLASQDLVEVHKILEHIRHFPSPPAINWAGDLDKHVKKKREHHCPECNKKYVRKEYLERHLLSKHDFLKPFICNICNKRFTRLDNTRQHIVNKHHAIIVSKISNLSKAEKIKFLNVECITKDNGK